ncbi:MAG: hypothetical protein ACTJF0_10275 [Psychroflexus halocasei]
MKGLKVIIVFVLISLVACQKSEKSDVSETEKTVKEVKRDSFDMIPVILTGEITKSEQKNTWEEWLIIEDIVEVKAPQKQKVKLETK